MMNYLFSSAIAVAIGVLGWQVFLVISRQLERRSLRIAPAATRVLARGSLWYGLATALAFVLPSLLYNFIDPNVWDRIVKIGYVVVTAVLTTYLARELLNALLSSNRAVPLAASLVQSIIYVAVYILAAIVVMDLLGVNIAAMVAAVGVGGIIIGLALQETLANFFAGLYILLAGKFKVGDYILFDTLDGVVEDITWRTTILRRATNARLIVPNQRLSSSALTVFRAEQSPVMVRLEFLLAPIADTQRAQETVLEVLTTLIEEGTIDGVVGEPPPFVRFGDTTRNGVPMFVWIAARDYTTMFSVRSEALNACISGLQRADIDLLVLQQ